jgi:hypothetical protein
MNIDMKILKKYSLKESKSVLKGIYTIIKEV